MNKLTDDELNRKIHEWLGFKWHEPFDDTAKTPCRCCGSMWLDVIDDNPKYCTDHTAVREFFLVAIERNGEQMVGNYLPDIDASSYEIDMLRAVMLTPRQLAEAGALAVGIVED